MDNEHIVALLRESRICFLGFQYGVVDLLPLPDFDLFDLILFDRLDLMRDCSCANTVPLEQGHGVSHCSEAKTVRG